MYRSLSIAVFLSLGLVASALAESVVERLQQRVQVLTTAALAGRGSGTAHTQQTAEIIQQWLRETELTPGFGGEWVQEFPLSGKGWLEQDLEGTTSLNLAGLLPGRGPLADRFLIIGAHHDHLGLTAEHQGEETPSAGNYYPGANDNASGVAVAFEIMGQLAKESGAGPRRSLLLVLFGGEEVGLQGSSYFVNHSPVPLDQVDLMINLDTVGQMTENRLHVSGVGTARGLEDLALQANQDGLDLSLAQGGWSGSDHMSFNTREVPVLFIFGGPYPQYNTPRDTWNTLNYPGMERIARFGARLVLAAAIRPEPLDWIMVAQPELPEGEGPQNRSSWLGTLPDFTEEIAGYKLAGVFADSPAAAAGLLKGDVLVKLAGHQVTDLPTFTRALRANNPGDLVEITVLREGRSLNFTVVLGDRKNRK